jgi:hypothetical protein
VIAEAIGRETARDETGLTAGNREQRAAGHHGPQYLHGDVSQHIVAWATLGHRQSDGDRGIQMATGNMADGE